MSDNIYNNPWYVYIAKCSDKTLYTGVAKDVAKRIKDHNTTNICKYTRIRKPIKAVYTEECTDYNTARKREAEIKRFTRKQKIELVGMNQGS